VCVSCMVYLQPVLLSDPEAEEELWCGGQVGVGSPGRGVGPTRGVTQQVRQQAHHLGDTTTGQQECFESQIVG
jgi:hypothetical protein